MNENIKFFHGKEYEHSDFWSTDNYSCCRLCKTTSHDGKFRHWAKGLCRSCYRRLSLTHRLYNDEWNTENSKTVSFRQNQAKKDYKSLDPDEIFFPANDVNTLLDRYDWACAYCQTKVQGHSFKARNALQIEYRDTDVGLELVPVCRSCNCSKKNILDEAKLKRWAYERDLDYPIKFISPPAK